MRHDHVDMKNDDLTAEARFTDSPRSWGCDDAEALSVNFGASEPTSSRALDLYRIITARKWSVEIYVLLQE